MLKDKLRDSQSLIRRAQIIEGDLVIAGEELLEISHKITHQLRTINLNQRNHISIILPSGSTWLIIYLALVEMGATIIPIDAALTEEEINAKLQHSDTDFVIGLSNITNSLLTRTTTFQVHNHELALFKCSAGQTHVTDERSCLMMIFSSGTGGQEKLVMLSDNCIESIIDFYNEQYVSQGVQATLSILPLTAIYPLVSCIACLCSAKKIIFSQPGDKLLLSKIADHEGLVIPAVPIVVEAIHANIINKINQSNPKKIKRIKRIMLISGLFRQYFFCNLAKYLFRQIHRAFGFSFKGFISGGAGLNKHVLHDMYCFGFNIIEGYGLTETGGALTIRDLSPSGFGSAGTPLKDVEITLSESEYNRGEILVKSSRMMLGYYKQVDITAASFDNGWFKTGDIGYFDAKGNLSIVGRLKDIIVKADEKKYFPEQIERYYLGIPGVKELAIVGLQSDNHSGDLVALIVVPTDEKGNDALKQKINALSNILQPAYQVDEIFFDKAIPRNKLGKICRQKIINKLNSGR